MKKKKYKEEKGYTTAQRCEEHIVKLWVTDSGKYVGILVGAQYLEMRI